MPLPKPRQNENQSDFISRCLDNSNVQSESSNHEQAVAICMSQWRNRESSSMTINEKLLKAIRSRGQKREPFEFGILTADRWVLNLQDQIGLDNCYKFACGDSKSFGDVLAKAAETLTYGNKEMVLESKLEVAGSGDLDLPKNTLMAFSHILTSSSVDRDGDILRSNGMSVDPKMLLLWQHVHTLPIGKSIKKVRQDDKSIEMISVIVDMNELCHDAAVMIDNGMGRFSHGFRALEFEEIKSEDGDLTGFDIKRAEIMEESLVSVPANTDAETQEVLLSLVEGGKLTSPIMKEYGKNIREKQNLVVPGISFKETVGDTSRSVTCGTTNEFKAVMGILEDKKDEGKTKGSDGGGEKGAGDDSSSEKANEDSDEVKGKKDSGVSEVKRYGSSLEGSWESKSRELRTQIKGYLKNIGLNIGTNDWIRIEATFDDYVIVCVEKPKSNVPNEFQYFKVEWEIKDDKPKLKGGYSRVDIVTTVEMRERAYALRSKDKQLTVDEAAAIVLAKSTEAQKRALICQLKSMLPTKLVDDYKKLMGFER